MSWKTLAGVICFVFSSIYLFFVLGAYAYLRHKHPDMPKSYARKLSWLWPCFIYWFF